MLAGRVAEKLAPGPDLAAWLSLAPAAGLDDAGLAAVAGAWRRLASWAQARELAAVAQIASRAAARDQDIGTGEDGRPERVPASAVAEVALELTMSRYGASWWAGLAVDLGWRLAATGAALESGEIDLYRARLICEATARLSDEAARAVEEKVLPAAGGQTPGMLRAALRRAVIIADPRGADERRRESERQAKVALYPDQDHTGTLAGQRLPVIHAAAAMARIKAIARAWKAAGAAGGMDLLSAKVYLGLLLGTMPLIPPAEGAPPDIPPPGDPGDGPDDPGQDAPGDSPPGDSPPGDRPPGDRPGSSPPGSSPPGGDQGGGGISGDGPPRRGRRDGGPAGAGVDGAGVDGDGPGGGPPGGGISGDGPPSGGRPDGSPPDSGPDGTAPGDGVPDEVPPPGDQDAPGDEEDYPCPGDSAAWGDGDGEDGGGQERGPAPDWPGLPVIPPAFARPAADGAGPLPGLLDVSLPWRVLAGASPGPGYLGRIGPVPASQARRLAGCAARDPAAEWRIIVTTPAGQAIAVTRIPRPPRARHNAATGGRARSRDRAGRPGYPHHPRGHPDQPAARHRKRERARSRAGPARPDPAPGPARGGPRRGPRPRYRGRRRRGGRLRPHLGQPGLPAAAPIARPRGRPGPDLPQPGLSAAGLARRTRSHHPVGRRPNVQLQSRRRVQGRPPTQAPPGLEAGANCPRHVRLDHPIRPHLHRDARHPPPVTKPGTRLDSGRPWNPAACATVATVAITSHRARDISVDPRCQAFRRCGPLRPAGDRTAARRERTYITLRMATGGGTRARRD